MKKCFKSLFSKFFNTSFLYVVGLSFFSLFYLPIAFSATESYRDRLANKIRNSLSDEDKELAEKLADIKIDNEVEQKKANSKNRFSQSNTLYAQVSNDESKKNLIKKNYRKNDDLIGVRYLFLVNKTKFQSYTPYTSTYGNPNATIDWEGIKTHQLEIFSKNYISNEVFTKGALGFKVSQKSGSMRDIDFLTNQVSYIDSSSYARNSKNNHLKIDIGKDLNFGETKLSPFIGFYYQSNKVDAYGGVINPVENNSLYNSMGWSAGMSNIVSGIDMTYETIVKSPRLGINGKYFFSNYSTIDYEFTYFVRPKILLNDTHYYSMSTKVSDGNPNGVATGYGTGYGAEIIYNHYVTDDSKLGVGISYQQFRLANKDMYFNTISYGWVNTPMGLKELLLKQYGLIFNLEIKY